MKVNGFDCDGVITVGIYPGPDDFIITGRSYEEEPETLDMLHKKGIYNKIAFNPIPFNQKTRQSSGEHKALKIKILKARGIEIVNFFEDDEIQKAVIERECPWVNVVHVVHDLTEKENVRHIEDTVERLTQETSPEPITKLFQFPYEHFSNTLLKRDDYLLDIACGNGLQTEMLKSKCANVISMDVEQTQPYVRIGNITDIPLQDESVDVIFSFETIEHLPRSEHLAAVMELLRVARRCVVIGTIRKIGPDWIGCHKIWKAVNGENPYHLGELDDYDFMHLFNSNVVLDVATPYFYQSSYSSLKQEFSMLDGMTSKEIPTYCNYVVLQKVVA